MNIAYSRYLQNALEHSTLTDEEKQGAHAFLKFLSTYKPTGLNVREPDFYGYGDAFGQYGVTYFDKQTLEDYGIDPDELDAIQFDQLMTCWSTKECSACASTVPNRDASTCTASPAYSTTRMTKAVGYWNSNRDSTGMPRSWLEHSSCRPARSDTSSLKPFTRLSR